MKKMVFVLFIFKFFAFKFYNLKIKNKQFTLFSRIFDTNCAVYYEFYLIKLMHEL